MRAPSAAANGSSRTWSVSSRAAHHPTTQIPNGSSATASTASKEDVAAGAYPLSYPLNLYLWEDPAGIDPLAYEYCRLALSRQGQEAVARQTPTEEGYVPLSAAHLALQRAKLESWAGEVA